MTSAEAPASNTLAELGRWLRELRSDSERLLLLVENEALPRGRRRCVRAALERALALFEHSTGIEELGFLEAAFVIRAALGDITAEDARCLPEELAADVRRVGQDLALMRAFLGTDLGYFSTPEPPCPELERNVFAVESASDGEDAEARWADEEPSPANPVPDAEEPPLEAAEEANTELGGGGAESKALVGAPAIGAVEAENLSLPPEIQLRLRRLTATPPTLRLDPEQLTAVQSFFAARQAALGFSTNTEQSR